MVCKREKEGRYAICVPTHTRGGAKHVDSALVNIFFKEMVVRIFSWEPLAPNPGRALPHTPIADDTSYA
jgi:hypothetical protein